jgi:hypothetical protein
MENSEEKESRLFLRAKWPKRSQANHNFGSHTNQLGLHPNLLNIYNPSRPLTIPSLTTIHSRKHGSTSQQRKGHIVQRHPLLPHPSGVAQDYPRAGRRPDLQARKKGCYSFADWCCPKGLTRYRSGQGCYW